MLIQLIQVDNDSGRTAARMGRGPEQILGGGAAERLRSVGHQVETIRVESRDAFPLEIATGFELARSLARQVRMATRQRRFPIVLAGNCLASLGVVAGYPPGRTGLVWLDAHADLQTPETTASGFLDGMALATILGLCWTRLATSLQGFRPVSAPDVLLLGARDLEEAELRRIEDLGIYWRDARGLRGDYAGVRAALEELGSRVDHVHLHVDLDVLDPEAVAPANAFAAPDGLRLEEVIGLVGDVHALGLGSVTLSSYDPAADPEGRIVDAAISILEAICR